MFGRNRLGQHRLGCWFYVAVIACTDYLIDIPAPDQLAIGSHTFPTLLTTPNGADCQGG